MEMILSPGAILSTNALDALTPDTTVPFASALFAKIMPSFPGGAMTVTLLLLEVDDFKCCDEEYGLLLEWCRGVDPPLFSTAELLLPSTGISSLFS